MAHCAASTRTCLAGSRVLFNQIRLIAEPQPHPPDNASTTTIVPVGCKAVSSSTCPENPQHFGKILNMPFASDWHDTLFQNYTKMLNTDTFSAPMLRSMVCPDKSILRPRIACKVKDTTTPGQYDLYAQTCADSST